jgi:hypothetical protein
MTAKNNILIFIPVKMFSNIIVSFVLNVMLLNVIKCYKPMFVEHHFKLFEMSTTI